MAATRHNTSRSEYIVSSGWGSSCNRERIRETKIVDSPLFWSAFFFCHNLMFKYC